MPRWLWWTPLGVMMLGFALVGLRWGWVAATVTETDVINRYAGQYVRDHGGAVALTDCAAFPAPDMPGVWLVVRCQPPEGRAVEYHVNRLGALQSSGSDGDIASERPQT